MESIQARLSARLGPLPVWAWAALALVLIIGFMWWKKIGFFAASSDQPSATGSGPTANSADLPVGVGGLAGAGSLAAPTDPNAYVPVPSAGYGSNYSSVAPSDATVVSVPSADAAAGVAPSPFSWIPNAARSIANAPVPGVNTSGGFGGYQLPVGGGIIPGRAGSGSTQF